MSSDQTKGFFLSTTLHVVVIVLLLLGAYAFREPPPLTTIFEVVAGEGDNFAATVAPKLGTPGGLKIDFPAPLPVQPEPVRVTQPEPAPAPPPAIMPPPPAKMTPAPTPKAATPPAPKRTIAKEMLRQYLNGTNKAKREIAKERAEEKRREEEARKRAEAQKAKAAAASAKAPRIDAEGIAKGVLDGSTENKVGGAGGKALRADTDDVLAAYFSMFKQRVRERFEPPPGLSDALSGKFEFTSSADGRISSVRVVKSSGSREFDNAVIEAIDRVRMPARPDKKTEAVEFTFAMRDANQE
jgi:colicin import membrane protein